MTEGIDGDHIDVFLSDKPDEGDVYVVDQVNENGEFDEHKVMYGFNSHLSAKRAYLSNYSKDWKGLGNITKVSKEDFKKWVNSSKRKTKPFAEYTIAKKENVASRKRIISEDRYKEVREQLRKELSQLNMGLNPKIMILAGEAAVYHIENGAYKFVDFSKKVIKDFGEEIRPYLKSMYNSARDFPGMESIAEKMDDYNVVKKIDINSLNTAEDEHNRGRNQQENPELGREKQQEVGRSKRTRVDRSNDGNSLFDQIGSAGVAEPTNINETAGLEEVQTQTEVKAPVSLKEEKKEERISVVKM